MKSASSRRQDKLELRLSLSLHRGWHLLSSCLRAWAGAFLVLDEDARHRRSSAVELWRRGVLSRAMAGWKERAVERGIKREHQFRAVNHDQKALVSRVLTGWAAVYVEERDARRLKVLQLKEIRNRLALLKAGRLLLAWVDIYQRQAMKRFQVRGMRSNAMHYVYLSKPCQTHFIHAALGPCFRCFVRRPPGETISPGRYC